MSAIQTIREKGAPIIIVLIAVSLIAFIMMDAFVGNSRGGFFSNKNAVAKINGFVVSRTDYEQRISDEQAIFQQQGMNIAREQVLPYVWQKTVEETVVNQQADLLGLSVGTKEMGDILFGNDAPQWMRQSFKDANGNFDAYAARQAIANLKNQKETEESRKEIARINQTLVLPSIQERLKNKYVALITQSIYVPKWLAKLKTEEENQIAKIAYVYQPYSQLSNDQFAVSDDEIRAYEKKHIQTYTAKQPSRSIRYVTFNAAPSKKDSAAVLAKLADMKEKYSSLTAIADIESYLSTQETETPDFKTFTDLLPTENSHAEELKSLKKGAVFGPYLKDKYYTLAKMIDTKIMPDSAKVRHILILVSSKGQPEKDSVAVKKQIDSLAMAIKKGADFNELVLKYSEDPGSKNNKGEYTFSYTQYSGLSKEFADVAFLGKTGDKKIIKLTTPSYWGYDYIEVLNQQKPKPVYQIAYLSKSILPSSETIDTASEASTAFSVACKASAKQFIDNAQSNHLPILMANDIKPMDYSAGSLEPNRAFVRWIFDNKQGAISEPFEIGNKFVVAWIDDVQEKGLMNPSKARPSVEPILVNQKKAAYIIKNKFATIQNLESLSKASQLPISTIDSLSYATTFIKGLGNEPKLVGAAFNKNYQNKTIDKPIAGASGVFAIQILQVGKLGSSAEPIKDEEKQQQLRNQLQQINMYQGLGSLIDHAKIDDYRYSVY